MIVMDDHIARKLDTHYGHKFLQTSVGTCTNRDDDSCDLLLIVDKAQ